jgi:hypothetical protein
MESKSDLLEEQPPSMDVRSAIEELQSRNAAFEQRFTGLGDALVEINSALQGLQSAVQDLVFNRQRPVQEEKNLQERKQQNNRVQIISPITSKKDEHNSNQDEEESSMHDVFHCWRSIQPFFRTTIKGRITVICANFKAWF